MRRWLVLVTLLGGCQIVFSLDRPPDDAPIDAAIDTPDARVAEICTMQDFSNGIDQALLDPYNDPGVTLDVAQGELRVHLAPNQSIAAYGGLAFKPAPLDFTGGSVTMRVVQLAAPSPDSELELKLSQTSSRFYHIALVAGTIRMNYQDDTGNHILSDRPYILADEPVLRIRHDADADMMVFETSTDGTSFGNQKLGPVTVALQNIKLGINIGTNPPGVNNPGTAIIDDVTVAAFDCPAQ